LRPVNFTELRIDGDADTPLRLIAPVFVAAAGFDQCFDVRAVEVRTHHAHALAVAPIKLALRLVEVDLFRRVRDALRNDDLAIPAIDVRALNRSVIQAWAAAHVGPVDMTSLGIDHDAVGQMAIGRDGLTVGTVRIHGVNAAGA
jgi:hypothetical protein